MGPPNVLWICSDQQRWDTLGCYGNPFVRTPNLDRLAGLGTLFENCYSQSPVCTPSRASFLTGRYPRTTRCRQNGQDIPEDEVLVTRLLADAGYDCGLAGKLHLSACCPSACPDRERRPRMAEGDGYRVFHWSHHPDDDWPTNDYQDWLREKGRVLERRRHPDTKWVSFGPPEDSHQTTWCAEKAMEFIAEHARADTPWLFSVNMFDPHHPFDPPEEYLDRYMPLLHEVPLPNYVEGELAGKPRYQRINHEGAYGGKGFFPYSEMSETDHRLVRAAYWAMCDLIDAQVGRMLDALSESGQDRDTLVIFTSDHGEMLGDHGIYLKGPFFYEPAVHVPLIISWPGVVESGRCSGLVELVDLAQTLLDAAGVPHHPGMQGRSLWPVLRGTGPGRVDDALRTTRHRDSVYCEYYNALGSHRNPTAQMTMVRTRRYKIAVDHSWSVGTTAAPDEDRQDGQDAGSSQSCTSPLNDVVSSGPRGAGGELYDLEKDPTETRNLWNCPGYAGVKADMLLELSNRMAWTVDPLPKRRGGW